jgi:hypothetical protein
MSASLSLRQLLGLIGSGLAASAILAWTAPARAQEEREIIIQKVLVAEKEGAEDDDDDKPAKANYWIGIGGGIVDNGLKIENVFPDSPAAKAGLKSGDVVAAVGDKKIEKIEQLVDLVQDSRGRELKLKVLREGKELGIVVKPGQRPKELVIEEREEREGKEEKKEPNRYQPKPGQPGAPAPGTPLPGSSAGPGAIPGAPRATGERRMRVQAVPMTPGTPASGGFSFGAPGEPAAGTAPRQPAITWMTMSPSSAQLPDDMQVTVSKKGNKPAVVTAKQGDKLWKTTENELGMLPQPAQAYASRLLGKDVRRVRTMGGTPGMMPGIGGGMQMQGMPGMPGMEMRGAAMPGGGGERIELRIGEGGKVEAIQSTGGRPNIRSLPGGGIQVEIREEGEKKEKPEAGESDPDRARRIKSLQEQADRLRGLLEKLRAETKDK